MKTIKKCYDKGVYVENVPLKKIENEDHIGKPIFLVMSFSDVSPLACAIVIYTKTNFSHVVIALNSNLRNMYSFAASQGINITDIQGGFCYESLADYVKCGAIIQVNNLLYMCQMIVDSPVISM